MKKIVTLILIALGFMAKAQTYGDEGPTLTPNAFGLVYENAIEAIDRGDTGRSFNLGYGNNGFGNFQDYTYNHTYTPAF